MVRRCFGGLRRGHSAGDECIWSCQGTTDSTDCVHSNFLAQPEETKLQEDISERITEAVSCYLKRNIPVLAVEALLKLARYYAVLGKRKEVCDVLMNAYETAMELPVRTKVRVIVLMCSQLSDRGVQCYWNAFQRYRLHAQVCVLHQRNCCFLPQSSQHQHSSHSVENGSQVLSVAGSR